MKIVCIILIIILMFLGIEVRDIDENSLAEKYCKKHKYAEFSSVKKNIESLSIIGSVIFFVIALILFVFIFSI